MGLRDRAILGLIVEQQASSAVLSRLNLADFRPTPEFYPQRVEPVVLVTDPEEPCRYF